MFDRLVRRIRPYGTSVDITRASETLPGFVWRASGVHQLYAGLIAVAVALLTFAPIDLQRRIVDDAIEHRDVRGLIWLGGIYALAILVQAGLKYTLFVYQGWVGESAVKESRDQLAVIAADRAGQGSAKGGQTVNVIGREIDTVGGFVGTSISDFVVNLTLMVSVATYMIYIQPTIALVSAIFLVPQIFLAFYMQRDLNVLVERQVGLVRKLGTEAIAESPDRSSNPAGQFRTIRAIFDNRMQFNFVKYGLKELLNIANAIGPLMVLLVGGYLVIQGQTTIGIVVAFVSGFERLSAPLRDLLDFYRDYEQARVQYQMITKWARGNVPAPEQG
jgi:ABC-type bacteriocin/lantibiotic exporter with double-glycine peptidase domain